MGCLFGGRLNPYADVILVGHWPEQLQALRQGPLRFIHPDEREELVNLRATNDLDQVGLVDVALVVTKSHQTAAAAHDVARVLASDGLVITLQNGIGNRELLAAFLGEARVIQGVTMQGASTGGMVGFLRYAGGGPTYLTRQAHEFASLLERAGLEVELVDDMMPLVWDKLAVNAAINPLTALLRVPNGALLASEWARRLMGQAAQEVAAVAAAQNISLPFADVVARVEMAARLTASNHSSMLQDVRRHAETEIEVICGAVVRAGERFSVPTPVNRVFYDLIKALENSYNHH